jgi:hypothetical protein
VSGDGVKAEGDQRARPEGSVPELVVGCSDLAEPAETGNSFLVGERRAHAAICSSGRIGEGRDKLQ